MRSERVTAERPAATQRGPHSRLTRHPGHSRTGIENIGGGSGGSVSSSSNMQQSPLTRKKRPLLSCDDHTPNRRVVNSDLGGSLRSRGRWAVDARRWAVDIRVAAGGGKLGK